MKAREKITALPLRKECDPSYEPEIWQPSWQCFCCEDTGIAKWAIYLFMEGYEAGKCRIPVCQSSDCEAGSSLGAAPSLIYSLDWRLVPALCQEADLWNREQWREWAKDQQQRIRNTDLLKSGLAEITAKQNLRMRDRSAQEERVAQLRHEEA